MLSYNSLNQDTFTHIARGRLIPIHRFYWLFLWVCWIIWYRVARRSFCSFTSSCNQCYKIRRVVKNRISPIPSHFEKFRKIRWKPGKFERNVVDVWKEQKNFGTMKFGQINRIIGWIFWKFSHRIPAGLAKNSAKFCRDRWSKKSQKILAWPTLNLYITITHISF
jgi:hypothetical protein